MGSRTGHRVKLLYFQVPCEVLDCSVLQVKNMISQEDAALKGGAFRGPEPAPPPQIETVCKLKSVLLYSNTVPLNECLKS